MGKREVTRCDRLEAAVWDCFRRFVPESLHQYGLSADPGIVLLCTHSQLMPTDYVAVQSVAELGVDPVGTVGFGPDKLWSYLELFLQSDCQPPPTARHFAWRSSWAEIPDIVRVDYRVETLIISVLLSQDAGVVLVSGGSAPLLDLPAVERRDWVARTITRLVNPEHFRLWTRRELPPPYCELPADIEEGLYIGSRGMEGSHDAYFAAGVHLGQLFVGFVKQQPEPYGSSRPVLPDSPPPNTWLRRP